MRIRSIYTLIAPLTSYLRLAVAQKTIPIPGYNGTNPVFFAARSASTMALEDSQMNVQNGPLQPHSREGDTTHPTGFFRDGYCWGRRADGGKHFIGGVVTNEFLEFSKAKGNDLMTPRPGFVGLKEGCRWCLCVERWKEALVASATMGERVVPRVDLSSTAMDALNIVKKEDLERFAVTRD